jgi:hypothetical protein
MNRYGLVTAILLLLVINAFVLAGVAHNRSGTPGASVVLTERELPLAYNYRQDENSGVALRLNWNRQGLGWFDHDKLAELGFDVEIKDSDEHRNSYYRALPIKAYVVLEYEGQAWEDYRDKQREEIAALPTQVAKGKMEEDAAERRKKELETTLKLASRLFAIDVGQDAAALRNRYPDTEHTIIVSALVRAITNWEKKPGKKKAERIISGRIDELLAKIIHVRRQHHVILEKLPSNERLFGGNRYYNPDSKKRVHYQVRLNFGQRHEPWVEGIEAL